MASSIATGRIVWATVRDAQGRNPKCRPGVVLNDPHRSGDPVIVAAITTTFSKPLKPNEVMLVANQVTKLRESSVVVCDWIIQVKETDIESYAGSVGAKAWKKIVERLPKP